MGSKNKGANLEEILKWIPVLRPEFFLEENEGLITIKRANNLPMQRFFRKCGFTIPLETTISLDKRGSIIVKNINSKNTIEDIKKVLSKELEDKTQFDERIFFFLNSLESRYKCIEFK